MSLSLPILFAAGLNEIVSVLVGLAFFVIWVINQINDAKKKQAAQEQKKKMEAMQQAGDPNPAPAPSPPADPLRAQVDEFLRRAGKQPAAGRPQPKTQKPAGRDEVVVLLDESAAATPPRKTLAEKMRVKVEAAKAQRAKPTASQISRTPPRPQQRGPSQPRPQTVIEHVTQHVGTASEAFRQEVADLGQSVRQADEQFDVQLHQKFDHELGSLGHSTGTSGTTEAGSPPRSPAAQIAAMLASPEGVRQAIILNEILHRPSDRW